MKKHQKKWSVPEKLEVLNYEKLWGAAKTTREFNVSTTSIYKWKIAYDEHGEIGLSANRKKQNLESNEILRLRRENNELKTMVAEKELRLRIQADMLKKSR